MYKTEKVPAVDYSDFIKSIAAESAESNSIPNEYYTKYNVKRGLRNADGTGVLVGLTHIGDVRAYIIEEGEAVPMPGKLLYRGVEINDFVNGFQAENRFGFEECAYLLLTGKLPDSASLAKFTQMLDDNRALPDGFAEDMIMKAPSNNIMNKLARCVLASYTYDSDPDNTSLENVLRQCISLIAKFPTMVAYAYQAKRHYYDGKSLYIHNPKAGLSTAETFLYMIRPDRKFTSLEAEILDLNLVIHAEHGGRQQFVFYHSGGVLHRHGYVFRHRGRHRFAEGAETRRGKPQGYGHDGGYQGPCDGLVGRQAGL